MEDQGEIVSFMGHDKENETLKVNDKIVFVMDDVKGSPTKKRRISKARLRIPPALTPCCIRYVSPESGSA